MRWPWIVGGLSCVVAALALAALPFIAAARAAPDLPDLGQVPDFSLTEADARPFTNADLEGKVWVADFMFTSCPSICPVLSRNMAALQAEIKQRGLEENVRLVGFSVDPETDGPEVLRAYREKFDGDPDVWKMLTGARADLWTLCREGFKLHVQDNPGNAAEPITHDGRFVLVDQRGVIRGYYDGLDPDQVPRIADDAAGLVKRGG